MSTERRRAERKSGSWTTAIVVPSVPSCPICGDTLKHNEFDVRYPIAVCNKCMAMVGAIDLPGLRREANAHRSKPLTVVQGITFWTPNKAVLPGTTLMQSLIDADNRS